MIKKFFIANLVLAAMLIGICYSQLHASDTRRSGREIKALAQIEWTEADIQKGRDVAFAQAINTIANQSPESLRDYLATHKFKRYPATYNQAAQQKHYNTIVASVERAIKKSPGSAAANDLALEVTQFVKTIDPHIIKKLDLDTRASALINLAQAAGGGPVAPPPPAPEVQVKEDEGLKRLQTIAEIERILAAPIGFTDALSNTDTLSLEDFMKSLGNFLINKFDEKAQDRLSTLAKTVDMYNQTFTFEMEVNFVRLQHLHDDWKNFYKAFSKKQLITTLNKAILLKRQLEKILNEIKKKPLSKILQADPGASKKKSGVYNSKLHDIWYKAQPSYVESLRKPKPTAAQQVQDLLKNFDFSDLEKSFNDTQSARNIIDKLSKQTFWKENPLLVEKIKNENEYKELSSLEAQFKDIQQEFISDFNSGNIPANYAIKTPEDATDFVRRAQALLKIFEPWTDITKDKAGILVSKMRNVKIQTREDAIVNEAQAFKKTFMSEKIGFDSAFGDQNSSLEDFIKSLSDFLQAYDANTQAQFSDDQRKYFDSLKKFYDTDYNLNFNQKVADTKSELELGELRFNAESFKETLQNEKLPLRKLLQADDANQDKPQHRNKLLGDLWKAKVITEIDELLAWKIDFNNAFAYKDKLTIPEFMTKLKEYLSKFDNDAKTRMEKGWYKSWMPKIYDGLKIFYEIDWLKNFKNKYYNKSDITTLTEIEDLLRQLNAIKQTITDKTFDGVNIFRNNMKGQSVGWTYNGNLNNMSNYATPMKRWVVDWFTGPTNMPTEEGEATQANEILQKINLDAVKNNLDTTTPIKTEIDTLITTATAADATRTNKVKADYYYPEIEGIENRFNTLKTEYDSDTINTPIVAEDFKKRTQQLSFDIAAWSDITNEKPKKLKEALEAIPVIVQKIAEIETLLKNPIGYENAFGTADMTITDFMKSLGAFVGQFTEEDKQYLSESPKKNLTALQERVNTYQDFSNKLVNLQETDTIQKIETLSNSIKKLINDINGKEGAQVFEKYYAIVNDPSQTEPHTRNNYLKTIWTEVMVGRKITTIQKQLDEPVSFPNAFGEATLTVNQFMTALLKFMQIFTPEVQGKMSKDQRKQLTIIHTFYTEIWNKNFKTILENHLNKTTLVKTVAQAEALQQKLETLLLQIKDNNGDVGKFFRADNEEKNNPQGRNNLLSALWTEAEIAKKIIAINEAVYTQIDFDTHFGRAGTLTVKTFMGALGMFLKQFTEKEKQRLNSAQLKFYQVPDYKVSGKLQADLRVSDNLNTLITFFDTWVKTVKTQGEDGYKPAEIKQIAIADALLNGFNNTKNGILTYEKTGIKKLIEGAPGESLYLKNIEQNAQAGFFESLLTKGASTLNTPSQIVPKPEIKQKEPAILTSPFEAMRKE